MSRLRRHAKLLLATAAIGLALPLAVSVAQNAPPAKVPSTPQPPPHGLKPLQWPWFSFSCWQMPISAWKTED